MEPMKPMSPMKPMEPIAPQERWWPHELGEPESSGSQDDLRYAYFAGPRRLAVQQGSRTTVYDTGDHRIGGVSQGRRDGAGGATFTSQRGEVRLDDLKVVTQ